jgi:hypothetical protein
MLWIGFEPTIPAFKWAKTVPALDRTATAIGEIKRCRLKCHYSSIKLATSDLGLFSLSFGHILCRKCRVSQSSRQSILEYEPLDRFIHEIFMGRKSRGFVCATDYAAELEWGVSSLVEPVQRDLSSEPRWRHAAAWYWHSHSNRPLQNNLWMSLREQLNVSRFNIVREENQAPN